jgi:hypothetical protein
MASLSSRDVPLTIGRAHERSDPYVVAALALTGAPGEHVPQKSQDVTVGGIRPGDSSSDLE